MKVKVTQSCPTLCNPTDHTVHGMNSPSQNTGVGSPYLLQGIFPTQGSNPGIPQGKPKNTKWVLVYLMGLSISPADLPNPGIELGSPALQTDSLPIELSGKPKILD